MKILIRGAGDLATGIAAELWERGHQILMTDVAIPLTVRREVAFSRAVYFYVRRTCSGRRNRSSSCRQF